MPTPDRGIQQAERERISKRDDQETGEGAKLMEAHHRCVAPRMRQVTVSDVERFWWERVVSLCLGPWRLARMS